MNCMFLNSNNIYRPRRMAVTHADLEPSRGKTCLSSKTCAFLIVLTILLGIFCFILCLIAEATRSKVTWMSTSENVKGDKAECVYSGSGKMPLICALCAFLGLAIAMLLQHAYVLMTVSKSSPALLALDPHSASAKSLSWQAGFYFITTWICFAVGEILLLAGVSVELGHLKNWSKPRHTCHVITRGLFSSAGAFALTTVSLASGLYITALRAHRVSLELENHVRRQVLESSAFHANNASQPHSLARENPTTKDDLLLCLCVFPTPFK